MLKCVTLLVALQWTRDIIALDQMGSREFVLRDSPSYGPRRLPGVWLAPSLISCAVSCVSSFDDECQSVLYNPETYLCTPGQKLDPLQPSPSAAEGLLYLNPQCESYEGFSLETFGEARVCVFYETEAFNYTDAADRCASKGSVLYMVKDMDKFYLLRNILKGGLWVGLNDMVTEGVYVWSDGEVFQGNFTDMFSFEEPNDYMKSEDCTIMNHPMPFMLSDDSCNKKYHSVCERPV